jgi:hypothetical protein
MTFIAYKASASLGKRVLKTMRKWTPRAALGVTLLGAAVYGGSALFKDTPVDLQGLKPKIDIVQPIAEGLEGITDSIISGLKSKSQNVQDGINNYLNDTSEHILSETPIQLFAGIIDSSFSTREIEVKIAQPHEYNFVYQQPTFSKEALVLLNASVDNIYLLRREFLPQLTFTLDKSAVICDYSNNYQPCRDYPENTVFGPGLENDTTGKLAFLYKAMFGTQNTKVFPVVTITTETTTESTVRIPSLTGEEIMEYAHKIENGELTSEQAQTEIDVLLEKKIEFFERTVSDISKQDSVGSAELADFLEKLVENNIYTVSVQTGNSRPISYQGETIVWIGNAGKVSIDMAVQPSKDQITYQNSFWKLTDILCLGLCSSAEYLEAAEVFRSVPWAMVKNISEYRNATAEYVPSVFAGPTELISVEPTYKLRIDSGDIAKQNASNRRAIAETMYDFALMHAPPVLTYDDASVTAETQILTMCVPNEDIRRDLVGVINSNMQQTPYNLIKVLIEKECVENYPLIQFPPLTNPFE